MANEDWTNAPPYFSPPDARYSPRRSDGTADEAWQGEPSNDVREIQELVAELTGMATAVTTALETVATATYSAADQSGSVKATLNGSGSMVRLELAHDWRRTVGRGGIAAAILEAHSAASQERVAGWVEHLKAQQPVPAGTAEPLQVLPSSTAPPTVDRTSLMRLMLQVLEEFDQRFTVAEEARSQGTGQTLESADGAISLVVTGASITKLTIDPDYLERASDSALSKAVLDSFHAAEQAPPPPEVQAMTKMTSEIDELVRMMLGSL